MLADVFSSPSGLRRPSAVPAVAITGPGSRSGDDDGLVADDVLIDQVRTALAAGPCPVPLPVVSGHAGTLVLFPLVDRADVSDHVRSLRAALPEQAMAQRSLSLPDLLALGPLAGRIHSSVGPG
jgi:hypothetical protein